MCVEGNAHTAFWSPDTNSSPSEQLSGTGVVPAHLSKGRVVRWKRGVDWAGVSCSVVQRLFVCWLVA